LLLSLGDPCPSDSKRADMGSRTLALICPSAMKGGRAGAIEQAIRAGGFAVLARIETVLTSDQASELYQ
jgi:nucleoside diphosphate kinase